MFFVLADLKRICETENGSIEIENDKVRQMLGKNGLTTQCIQAKNAISCKDMTLAQLCLKINSKMGEANNAIAPYTFTRLVSHPVWIIFHSLMKKEFGILQWKRRSSIFLYLWINTVTEQSYTYSGYSIGMAVLKKHIWRPWTFWIILSLSPFFLPRKCRLWLKKSVWKCFCLLNI